MSTKGLNYDKSSLKITPHCHTRGEKWHEARRRARLHHLNSLIGVDVFRKHFLYANTNMSPSTNMSTMLFRKLIWLVTMVEVWCCSLILEFGGGGSNFSPCQYRQLVWTRATGKKHNDKNYSTITISAYRLHENYS